jgi:hypothetical protein
MRRSQIATLLASLLILVSYSITVACDSKRADTKKTAQSDDTATASQVDVQATCSTMDHCVVVTQPQERSTEATTAASITSSVRAGVNLARALSRAMAHVAVAMGRTAYHTMVALT